MRPGLDIQTPKGEQSLAQEQEMLEIVLRSCPGYIAVQTPKQEPADVDGVVVKDGVIKAVFESKCRDLTMDQLRKFDNEWLITFKKLQRGAEIAKALCVPYIGYLYLVPEKIVLAVKLADSMGSFLAPIRIERTETQATINGGHTTRTNAYIDVSKARVFQ